MPFILEDISIQNIKSAFFNWWVVALWDTAKENSSIFKKCQLHENK